MFTIRKLAVILAITVSCNFSTFCSRLDSLVTTIWIIVLLLYLKSRNCFSVIFLVITLKRADFYVHWCWSINYDGSQDCYFQYIYGKLRIYYLLIVSKVWRMEKNKPIFKVDFSQLCSWLNEIYFYHSILWKSRTSQ